MNYRKIIRCVAEKENISKKEVEKEMKKALTAAGLQCTPQEFIQKITTTIKYRRYII